MLETLQNLAGGFATALTFTNLAWAFLGCLLGTAVGVLPGIGPAMTVAMLLPLTAKLDPTSSMIMFAGILYGAMFGGSTTSILLNTPGESGTMMTALEGNAMAKRGRAGPALATAAIGSFVAGTIATIALTFFAPVMADWALRLGPVDYCALIFMAFLTVSAIMGKSVLRGLLALGIGLALGMIGTDPTSGQQRYTFGVAQLVDGVDVVIVAVALFAVAEVLHSVIFERGAPQSLQQIKGGLGLRGEDLRRSAPAWLRGTAIGFPFGLLPVGGSEIPTFLSYATEKKLAKDKSEFGKGAIEGVAGPEAANNANVVAVLIPLLTLGIPANNTAAMMLAAFQSYGIQTGPTLFLTSAALVWALIASLYIGNLMLLVLNLPLVGLWVKMLSIPRPHLYAGIMVFACLGVYGVRQSEFDLLIVFVIGLLGLAMRRFDVPVAPVIVGMILGPLMETQLRRALSISQGDWMVFVREPISLAVLCLCAALLVLPWLWRRVSGQSLASETD